MLGLARTRGRAARRSAARPAPAEVFVVDMARKPTTVGRQLRRPSSVGDPADLLEASAADDQGNARDHPDRGRADVACAPAVESSWATHPRKPAYAPARARRRPTTPWPGRPDRATRSGLIGRVPGPPGQPRPGHHRDVDLGDREDEQRDLRVQRRRRQVAVVRTGDDVRRSTGDDAKDARTYQRVGLISGGVRRRDRTSWSPSAATRPRTGPDPGSVAAGSSSSHGTSTKPRSCARGCGSVSRGSSLTDRRPRSTSTSRRARPPAAATAAGPASPRRHGRRRTPPRRRRSPTSATSVEEGRLVGRRRPAPSRRPARRRATGSVLATAPRARGAGAPAGRRGWSRATALRSSGGARGESSP